MQLIGYARVSTSDQTLERQLDELRAHGCDRIFAETASGKRSAHRPEWDACLAHLRAGDTLVVGELSRLGRNTGDLGRLLDHLQEQQIGASGQFGAQAQLAVAQEPHDRVADERHRERLAVGGDAEGVPRAGHLDEHGRC